MFAGSMSMDFRADAITWNFFPNWAPARCAPTRHRTWRDRILLQHEGRLQPPFRLPKARIRHHGDSNRSPILVGKSLPLPAVEQARLAGRRRRTYTRPKLPGSIGRLPDCEIHRLLFCGGVLTQIRVSRYLPEIPVDLGNQCWLAGVQRDGETQ